MKKIFSTLLLSGLLSTSLLATEKVDNFMVVVTTDDSVTQLMAGVLSNQVKKQGSNVTMLFCGKAGSLVTKNSNEVKLKPKNVSPQMLIKKLIKSGGNVAVCPPYLPNAGKTKADLIEGVTVAKPPKIAANMISKNTQILSF